MSEYIRLQANGADAYPDASTENTYRPNGTSVESALVNLESNVTTLGGVAGEAKTLAEQNSVKIATAEQEISDINSSLQTETVVFTPTAGTSNAGIGGCIYKKCGNIVQIHLGISGLTKNTLTQVYTMPVELRPSFLVKVFGGNGSTDLGLATAHINAQGEIYVETTDMHIIADLVYIL